MGCAPVSETTSNVNENGPLLEQAGRWVFDWKK